ARDLLAELTRQMAADQHRDDLAERTVSDLLLGERDLWIEALRIADGEFQIVAARQLDQLVGFPQFERDRLFQHDVLAGLEAIARDRIMIGFRGSRDIDNADAV